MVYEREHRGVGAPVFAYRLSAVGEALFPRRYEEALTALLDQVVEREGRDGRGGAARVLFRGRSPAGSEAELVGAPPAERLQARRPVLSEEGYMAEVTARRRRAATLTEHNCAIPAVAERFPEICAAEARFLADVLGAEVSGREHILSGCSACEYHVRFRSSRPGEAHELVRRDAWSTRNTSTASSPTSSPTSRPRG